MPRLTKEEKAALDIRLEKILGKKPNNMYVEDMVKELVEKYEEAEKEIEDLKLSY